MQCWLFSGDEPFFGGVTIAWHGGEAPWPAGVTVVNIDLPPDEILGPDGLRLETNEASQVVGWRLVDHEGNVLASGNPPELDEHQRDWLALLDRRLGKGQLAGEAPEELNFYFCARIQAHPDLRSDKEPVPESRIHESLAGEETDVDYHLELLNAEGEYLPKIMRWIEPVPWNLT